MFGGKDLFGGKNPFAGRRKDLSSDEDDDVEEIETDSPEPSRAKNGGGGSSSKNNITLPPPAPPSIALQPDADEKPVSFDDLPTDAHVISSTTKSRVSNLPSRRRPTGKGSRAQEPTTMINGHSGAGAE